MNLKSLIFIALTATQIGLARRAAVPLMPYSPERQSASQPTTYVQHTERKNESSQNFVGIELGMIGRKQSTESDILGMQALLGARAFLLLPTYNIFTIKPSVGYFYKKESVGSVSVSQSHLEAGVGLLLTVMSETDTKWHVGLSNYITRSTSSSSVFSNSTTSPADIFLRSGPTTGILVRLGGRISLAADLEYTWSFERPTRSYMGLTSGLTFEM